MKIKLFLFGIIILGGLTQPLSATETQGYQISIKAGKTTSVVLPAYCIDAGKEAPPKGEKLASKIVETPQDVKRLLAIRDYLLGQPEELNEVFEKEIPWQSFKQHKRSTKEEQYKAAINLAIQWAIWRGDKKAFRETVCYDRLAVPNRLIGYYAKIIDGLTENNMSFLSTIDEIDTSTMQDDYFKKKVSDLFSTLKELKTSGQLFNKRQYVIEQLTKDKADVQKRLDCNEFAYWFSQVIDDAVRK